jgi:hypothetical protein
MNAGVFALMIELQCYGAFTPGVLKVRPGLGPNEQYKVLATGRPLATRGTLIVKICSCPGATLKPYQ